MQFRWAIVDVETTGLSISQDRMTEIAVIVLSEKGIETSWHRLINPGSSIPPYISQMTGISNEMVEQAPFFKNLADELYDLLEGCVLVAHNARFDYGFLKNAFKEVGFPLKTPVLCTIKLFKKLYPDLPKYNLNALARWFHLPLHNEHRAQDDVNRLFALIKLSFQTFSTSSVIEEAKAIYRQASIPSRLKTDINTIPDSPGVYLFYGSKSDLPLYIGKSIHLRQRIMSHFQADYSHENEFKIAQQVERVDIIPTAGELSALLLESSLIKEKMPLYNRKLRRKKTIVGFKLEEKTGYLTVEIVRGVDDPAMIKNLYGSFKNISAAKDKLLSIIKEYKLCPKLCAMEQSKTACFSFQLKRCAGACIGKEPAETYNLRLLQAFEELKQTAWPFKGRVAIKEQCEINALKSYMIFDQWRHLTTVFSEKELENTFQTNMSHNFDTYKILWGYLKKNRKNIEIIALD